MSETKAEYVAQYRRSSDVNWQESVSSDSKEIATRQFDYDSKRFPSMRHRLIRVTVLKESK